MKKRIAAVSFLLISSMLIGVIPALAFTVQSNANRSTKSEMKKGGQEAKNAGKSLGTNVKKGDVAKGGKEFGQHTANAAKHTAKGTAKGTKKAATTTAKTTENAAKTTGNATKTTGKATGNAAKKTGKTVKKTVTP